MLDHSLATSTTRHIVFDGCLNNSIAAAVLEDSTRCTECNEPNDAFRLYQSWVATHLATRQDEVEDLRNCIEEQIAGQAIFESRAEAQIETKSWQVYIILCTLSSSQNRKYVRSWQQTRRMQFPVVQYNPWTTNLTRPTRESMAGYFVIKSESNQFYDAS